MSMPDSPVPDFVAALGRGLAVLECFGPGRERQTLSQVAALTGLSRGTARRFLLTLAALDYLASDGKLFWLTPRVLRFSHGYLASFGRAEMVKPVIRAVSEQLNESCSMAVLDGADVVYIARVEARRVYSSRIDVGSRLPAHASSLGRVLLAGLPDAALDEWLARHPAQPWTARTITDPGQLRARIVEARRQRYAILDSELELGSRSIAVPVQDAAGRTLAALNIGTSAARAPLDQLRRQFLPVLRAAAAEIAPGFTGW
ncbi:IclR family transcriptional regulator domain-containing protein [Roseomonas sp. USHLN139]|uniref:IclR family transcriptional regulator domain-containing protein n=1 Tax=Roseomonas sp. USHLN139 TaxID=3081298 RepID=UPI003B0276F8